MRELYANSRNAVYNCSFRHHLTDLYSPDELADTGLATID